MRKILLIILIFTFVFSVENVYSQKKQESKVDMRIDNMKYWKRMAAKGYVSVAKRIEIPKPILRNSKIDAKSVTTEDSPDVLIGVNSNEDNTQSELSVFVNPMDNTKVLNSNNSTGWTGGSAGNLYGANYFMYNNGDEYWTGSVQGAGGGNSGDPATAISLDGRMYIGFIHSNSGQGVSYSEDNGETWTSVVAGTTTGSMLDKNHFWIDNSPVSEYEGNVYDAWTDFGGSMDNEIGLVSSSDGGISYSSAINVSSAVNAGSHNQGVNIQTGPEGQVYVVWSIYDSWPSDETALGFAKSTDGGETFPPATRVISNIKGIRTSETSKNQRVNSFPSMAVDISGGENNGNIYVVWTNIGEPGINSGTNRSAYIIKSEDEGETWSDAIRVNQGPFENGKEAYFPWITCDPETGTLSVIFYDDRDVSSTQVEAWVANSYDAGETWEDFRISDVGFTPSPIAGLAGGYMGDYLGISARGGLVYPVWCDNRNGLVQSFVSPFETNSRARPRNLEATLNQTYGQTDLVWEFTEEEKTMQYFIIYRNGEELTTITDTVYTDYLPDFGEYKYRITAMHDDGESGAANSTIFWGSAIMSVNDEAVDETIGQNQTTVKQISITNDGQVDLIYNISTEIIAPTKNNKEYCDASGGGDEFISGVVFGDISNTGTQASGYSDYTEMSTDIDAGTTYPITVTNGNTYSVDDLGVWIDWNQDGDFEDADENVVCEVSNGGQGTYDIYVSDNALGGATTMRVRIKYSGDDCGSPCGTTSYGEVEDYTVNVNSWMRVVNNEGIILPGNTNIINVMFISDDLEIGNYAANITVEGNDLNNVSVEIPVTLEVVEDLALEANPLAFPEAVCSGDESMLFANFKGGSGEYTFSWTSEPEGFTSDEIDPTVNSVETTIYTVEVSDGTNTVTSSVTVNMAIPEVSAIPEGSYIVGNSGGNSHYTTAGSEFAETYEWLLTPEEAGTITGNTPTGTVSWNDDFVGIAYVSVKGISPCGTGEFSEPFEVQVNEGTKISELNENVYCNIYPNPNAGTFNMKILSDNNETLKVRIFNEIGILVYENFVNVNKQFNSNIDLSNFSNGIYFVNISGENVNITKRLSIQK